MAVTSNYTVSSTNYTQVAAGTGETLIEVSDQGSVTYFAVRASQPSASFIGHEVGPGDILKIATPGNPVWAKSENGSSIVVTTE